MMGTLDDRHQTVQIKALLFTYWLYYVDNLMHLQSDKQKCHTAGTALTL